VAERLASGGNLALREFSDWAHLGRTRTYEEIAARRLVVAKLGRTTVVPAASALQWMTTQGKAA
jgi:hypothetical protein